MIDYYNRNGHQYMSWIEWVNDVYEGDRDLKRVAQTTFGPWWISTVWLGLNHSFSDRHPPLIFETMVFHGGWDDFWTERYSTIQEAFQGHDRIVESVIVVVQAEGKALDLKAITASPAPQRPDRRSSSRSSTEVLSSGTLPT